MNYFAVIVTFEPKIESVIKQINTLIKAKIRPVIVDNSEQIILDYDQSIFSDCIIIQLHNNLGIAEAQNIGIKAALSNNADAILLFDQDTQLIAEQLDAQKYWFELLNVPILAPIFKDKQNDLYYPVKTVNRFGWTKRLFPQNFNNKIQPVDIVISSGMLIHREVFLQVGLMDEKLFIDYVDTEFCIRCKKNNLSIYCINSVIYDHQIGENKMDFKFFKLPLHSPIRRYYQIRNAIYLIKKKDYPKILALRDFFFMCVLQIMTILYMRKKVYILAFLRGVKDGILGKMGKFN